MRTATLRLARFLLAGLLAVACATWDAGVASASPAASTLSAGTLSGGTGPASTAPASTAPASTAPASTASASTGPASTAPAGGTAWTVYHGNAAGNGVAGPVTAVHTGTRAWTSPTLDGQIYGEPLVWDGRVYVATENNTVYALSAANGAVTWSAHLGSPVPSGLLPCGDITPTVGITGTPVIDQSRGEIFVVADELTAGQPEHVLFGLSAASGQKELSLDVDPPGADPAALLQRTGLTLDDGQVVFGMGGNFGDCSSYRGRVAAVPETGGTPRFFTVDAGPGESQGAVWMGGAAPVVDGSGNVWVATGNGSVYSSSHAYDDGSGLLELSPSMQLLQFFAPGSWAADNSQDLDMSTAPVLLPDGQVMLTGKSGIVYLLDGAHLGGIGRQQAALGSACNEDIDGGYALSGLTAYLPCRTGIIAVRASASPPSLRLLWSSGTGGGPAIIAAGLVWTIGQNGTLYGLDPATGAIAQQAPVGPVANHFPTPAVADGLFLVPAARDVVAFAAADSGATSPTTQAPSQSSPPRARAETPGGGLSAGAIAIIVIAALVVASGGAWLLRRRLADRSNSGP
jgi:outer membrane protein assembly factor BamB